MYTKSSALVYDTIYATKDYRGEAQRVEAFIRRHQQSTGNTLLDVGCGTGSHLYYLQEWRAVEGLDLSEDLLNVARENLPDVPFHQGDMRAFDLGCRFDVVTCLFSAIGSMTTVEQLRQAIARMAAHVLPGGVLIVESWLPPDGFLPGRFSAEMFDGPDGLQVAIMCLTSLEGDCSVETYHYLIGRPSGIEYVTERFVGGLFTHQQYLDAFTACGLTVAYDPIALDYLHDDPQRPGRGMYIGRRPLEESHAR